MIMLTSSNSMEFPGPEAIIQNTLNEQLDYERITQRILCDGDVFKEGVTAFIEKGNQILET